MERMDEDESTSSAIPSTSRAAMALASLTNTYNCDNTNNSDVQVDISYS